MRLHHWGVCGGEEKWDMGFLGKPKEKGQVVWMLEVREVSVKLL